LSGPQGRRGHEEEEEEEEEKNKEEGEEEEKKKAEEEEEEKEEEKKLNPAGIEQRILGYTYPSMVTGFQLLQWY
jgi:hypothetical protein